jgi:hypothetical protein
MMSPIMRSSELFAGSRSRPLAGTALLAGAGALVGGVIGSALLFTLQFGAPGGIHPAIDVPFAVALGGTFGALVGGVTAPLMGWTLLRRVPFGRAIFGTAMGTLLGAGAGTVLGHPAIGGVAGYGMASAALFLVYRHRDRAG